MSENKIFQFKVPEFKPIPGHTRPSATSESAGHPASNVLDGNPTTYWLSDYNVGTVRLIFDKQVSMSILSIKTWYFNKVLATYTIYGKESISHPDWMEIGNVTREILPTTPSKPQTLDIDLKWGNYEIIEVRCQGLPIINEIEYF